MHARFHVDDDLPSILELHQLFRSTHTTLYKEKKWQLKFFYQSQPIYLIIRVDKKQCNQSTYTKDLTLLLIWSVLHVLTDISSM